MGSRDRPHREVKKKAKDPGKAKIQPIQPLMDPPTNVELIKPKRKPRSEESEET
jgi:hypothetical protein